MGRRWIAADASASVSRAPGGRDEIVVFAVDAGAPDRDQASIRRSLHVDVPVRVWHRVYPALPKELRSDGDLIVWIPSEAGWDAALECVHARRQVRWRKSGVCLQLPGSNQVILRDFSEFDDAGLADWSLAVPDRRFVEFCARVRCADGERLSELLARWALEIGPREAGRVVGLAVPRLPATVASTIRH
jgi:hypothetical protein